MALRGKLTRRKNLRRNAEPDDKAAVKSENEDAPRTINGIRVPKALTIIRQG